MKKAIMIIGLLTMMVSCTPPENEELCNVTKITETTYTPPTPPGGYTPVYGQTNNNYATSYSRSEELTGVSCDLKTETKGEYLCEQQKCTMVTTTITYVYH